MIKAAVLSLSAALLLNTVVSTHAQVNAAEAAEIEAVKRQEAIQLLHMKLVDAQSLQKSGRYLEAAKVYEDAYALFPRVGGSAAEDRKAVVAGLVATRLQLAQDARRTGNLQEADAQIKRAQKVDPQNANVLAFKLENDKAIAAARGNVPSAEGLARVPEVQNEKILAGTLVQDGKLLSEMGKIDEAEAKLKMALQHDPDNAAGNYYISLIKEHRFSRKRESREQVAKDALVEVSDSWLPSEKRNQLPFPNSYARTNEVHTSPKRQELFAKLNRIIINEVGYNQLPLSEVLKHLRDESIKRDPDKLGVNFMISQQTETAGAVAATPTDPNAPAVPVEATVPAIDLSAVTVKLDPPLANLRLADVLDAIVAAADQPIRYEIRDYAIMFAARAPEPVQLFTRTYKVDPNTFLQGLESVSALAVSIQTGGRGGGGGQSQDEAFTIPRVNLANVSRGGQGNVGNQAGLGLQYVSKTNITASANELVRGYFQTAGVDLTPPKSVFFNDRNGSLLVRASLQDLEIIEQAIQTLNMTPPQVSIEAKFAEISQEDSSALGFDWFLGNTLIGNGKMGFQTGSAPSYSGTPTTANPSGIFPGPGFAPGVSGPGTIFPSATDNLLTAGLTRVNESTPALATLSGILTDPQFRVVLRALESRAGVDLLSAPKVTTLSGRQAQISILDLITLVTDTDVEQNQGATGTTGAGGAVNQGAVGTTIEYTLQNFPFGPTLDVIPYVSADGYSIQMTIIPTITEFLGYDDPGNFVPQGQSVSGSTVGTPIRAVLPLPHLRLRQVTTSCNVWDGQTVVLGGLISEDLVKIKDKIPVLGDLPYLGRLFRAESNTSRKKNLVIFVSPRIIDPAGNPAHSEDEMPFARNSIPPQPVATAQ